MDEDDTNLIGKYFTPVITDCLSLTGEAQAAFKASHSRSITPGLLGEIGAEGEDKFFEFFDLAPAAVAADTAAAVPAPPATVEEELSKIIKTQIEKKIRQLTEEIGSFSSIDDVIKNLEGQKIPPPDGGKKLSVAEEEINDAIDKSLKSLKNTLNKKESYDSKLEALKKLEEIWGASSAGSATEDTYKSKELVFKEIYKSKPKTATGAAAAAASSAAGSESISVERVGINVSKLAIDKDTSSIALHPVEYLALTKALKILEGDAEYVVCDILVRDGEKFKLAGGKPEIHSVVLLKVTVTEDTESYMIIDPNDAKFSAKYCEILGAISIPFLSYDAKEEIGADLLDKLTAEQNIVFGKLKQFYSAGDRRIEGRETDEKRDCIDIAVKICFAMGSYDGGTSLEKLEKLVEEMSTKTIESGEDIHRIKLARDAHSSDHEKREEFMKSFKILNAQRELQRIIDLKIKKTPKKS